MTKTKLTTKSIVLAAMLAALTVAGSALRITLPLEIAGTTSFHLGNIMCALSGILLGPWLGGVAAGLGSAIYDMMNPLYISEAWITFLTKAAYGVAAGFVAWSWPKELGLWQSSCRHRRRCHCLCCTVPGKKLLLQWYSPQRSDRRRCASCSDPQAARHHFQCRDCYYLCTHSGCHHPGSPEAQPPVLNLISSKSRCRIAAAFNFCSHFSWASCYNDVNTYLGRNSYVFTGASL